MVRQVHWEQAEGVEGGKMGGSLCMVMGYLAWGEESHERAAAMLSSALSLAGVPEVVKEVAGVGVPKRMN